MWRVIAGALSNAVARSRYYGSPWWQQHRLDRKSGHLAIEKRKRRDLHLRSRQRNRQTTPHPIARPIRRTKNQRTNQPA